MEQLKKITFLGWLGIIILFNSTLLGGASQLGDLALTPVMVKAILAIATLGNGFLGGLVTMFSTQASQTSNVMADPAAQEAIIRAVMAMPGIEPLRVNAKANATVAALAVDPNQTKIAPLPIAQDAVTKIAAAGAILLALMIGSLWPDPAMAQLKLKPLTGNIGNDLGITSPSGRSSTALDNIATVLAKPFQDIATFIGEDADGAVALSTAIPNLQDGHGQQCWIAMQSFGAIIKAHPIPITFHVINDYESLRLLGIATNNLCSNVHCTQVFADFSAMAQAASPMPLPIPSLHDLCVKVPQIAVVAPISVPAPIVQAPTDATLAPAPAPAKP